MKIALTNQVKKKRPKNTDQIEEQRIKNIISKFRQFNPLEFDRSKNSKTIFESASSKSFLESSMKISTTSAKKLLEEIPENEEEITEEKKKEIEEEMKREEIVVKNKNINMEALRKVFGESFSQKGKNIKKRSLFGKLNSHKIFRCIIKTHEDLRQEQFATQLINEFYQI